uniref:NFKB inhibitor epsilon n=1 Tax=Cyanistes caeruleus TaxID=156563 RepID=A0A8C0U791_CYACU
MRKGENECRNESPGGGCTQLEKEGGGGGKQSFKAGTSQLQGENQSSGQGNAHPHCLCSMDAQTRPLSWREGDWRRQGDYSFMQQGRISAPKHGTWDLFFFFFLPCHRLVHLAIIHCVPAVALCCIAQLPREVLEIQNDLFQTPLHLAVYLEQPSVIQALIHKGVNPGLQDRNGNTPLHLACEQQHLQCAQQLLGGPATPDGTTQPHGHHQDLQLQNWQGLACLHISTLKGNIPMMSLLLESGANIDVREGTSGKTPLHLAVECHNRRAVQFLLRNGAYVDAQMYNGCTPLHLAVGRKDAAIAAILSHSGADTLLRNMENETAQDLADGNDDVSLCVGKPVALQVCQGVQELDDRGTLLGEVSSCSYPWLCGVWDNCLLPRALGKAQTGFLGTSQGMWEAGGLGGGRIWAPNPAC